MKRRLTFTLYEAKDGWRWRAKSSNGRVMADGGEGYKRKAGARKSLMSFVDHVECGLFVYEILD